MLSLPFQLWDHCILYKMAIGMLPGHTCPIPGPSYLDLLSANMSLPMLNGWPSGNCVWEEEHNPDCWSQWPQEPTLYSTELELERRNKESKGNSPASALGEILYGIANAEVYSHVVGHCNIYIYHALFQVDMGNWFYKKQSIDNAITSLVCLKYYM